MSPAALPPSLPRPHLLCSTCHLAMGLRSCGRRPHGGCCFCLGQEAGSRRWGPQGEGAGVRVHRCRQEAASLLGVCLCGPETLKDVQLVMATPAGAPSSSRPAWDRISRTKAREPSLVLLLASERPHTWPRPGRWHLGPTSAMPHRPGNPSPADVPPKATQRTSTRPCSHPPPSELEMGARSQVACPGLPDAKQWRQRGRPESSLVLSLPALLVPCVHVSTCV